MTKRKNIPIAVPCAPSMSPEEQKERYAKGYGFVKAPSVRSPLDAWEQRYFDRGDRFMIPDKAVRMIEGKPSTFKHRRDGNCYSNRPTRRKSK